MMLGVIAKNRSQRNRVCYILKTFNKFSDRQNNLSRFFHALPEEHVRLLRRRFCLVSLLAGLYLRQYLPAHIC